MNRIFTLLFLFCLSLSLKAQWKPTGGPIGGTVNNFFIKDKTIFACTMGVFSSTNNGDSWISNNSTFNNSDRNLDNPQRNMVASVIEFDGNFYASGNGIFKSSNKGKDWDRIDKDLPEGKIFDGLAFIGNKLFTFEAFGAVYLSTNGGLNWEKVYDTQPVYCLIKKDTEIFIGSKGILKTSDGRKWETVGSKDNIAGSTNALNDYYVMSLALDGSKMYAGTFRNGVISSTNNGQTWVLNNKNIETADIRRLVVGGSDIYALDDWKKLLKFNGSTWEVLNINQNINYINAIAYNDGALFVSTNQGIFRSLDRGIKWEEKNNGLSNDNTKRIEYTGELLFSFSNWNPNERISSAKWDNNGWSKINFSFNCVTRGNGTFLAGSNGEGLYSSSNGINWDKVNTNNLPSIITNIVNVKSNTYLLHALKIIQKEPLETEIEIYRSTSNISSWQKINSLPNEIKELFDIFSFKGLVFVTTDKGVFYSLNDGTSWLKSEIFNDEGSKLLDFNFYKIAYDNDVFFATTYYGICYSINNGKDWTFTKWAPSGFVPTNILAAHKAIFITTYDKGVLQSLDKGYTWKEVNIGLSNNQIWSISSSTNNLFIGMARGGVWQRPFYEFFIPNLEVDEPSAFTATSANISGKVTTFGDYPVNVQFELSENSNFNPILQTINATPKTVAGKDIAVSASIFNLKGKQNHFYRIKAIIDGDKVTYSSPREFTTKPYLLAETEDKQQFVKELEADQALHLVTEATVQVSPLKIKLNQPVEGTKVHLMSRRLTRDDWKETLLTGNGAEFSGFLPATQVKDELGFEYYFKITPPAEFKKANDPASFPFPANPIQVAIKHTAAISLPNELKFGKEEDDYNFVSLPFVEGSTFKEILSPVLGDNTVADRKKWRLMSYVGKSAGSGANYNEEWKEYLDLNMEKPEAGRGYWLAIAKAAETGSKKLTTGTGKTVVHNTTGENYKFDRENFIIRLRPGYNQIGNPFYNLNIPWSAIEKATNNPKVGKLIVYKQVNNEYTLAEDNNLEAFGGGYVMNNDDKDLLLVIPARFDVNRSGGRIAGNQDKTKMPLLVEFKLKSEGKSNELAGLGLHPEALTGLDRLDLKQPPTLGNFPLLHFTGPEALTQSVLPITGEGQQWEFTLSGIAKGKLATISWPVVKAEAGKRLWLHDLTSERKIDMLTTGSYSFTGNNRFKVYYGAEAYIQEHLLPQQSVLQVSPNPFDHRATIAFTLPQTQEEQQVKVSVLDAKGGRLGVVQEGKLKAGFHQVEWQVAGLKPGMYLIELQVTNSQGSKTYRSKVIRN